MSYAYASALSHAPASRADVASRALPASLLLVAAVAPFELPLAGPAGFTLTTVELLLIAALVCGAVAFAQAPSVLEWRTPITVPALAVLAVVTMTALTAPEFRGNALRVAGRLSMSLALFTIVVGTVRGRREINSAPSVARQLVATLVGVGAVVGAIAVLELLQVPAILDMLTLFRPGFHVVGGQLRATSTLFYPTIASMYLEVAFALGLVLVASRLGFVALAIIGAGVVATFTRAGLITMALSLAVYGAIVFAKNRRTTAEHRTLAALAAVLFALVVASRSPQMLAARMSSDTSQDWYGAAYDVPSTLALGTGSFNDVPVTLTNHGRLTWQSSEPPVFALSYHWLTADTEAVVIYDGLRTPFAQPVAPGGSVQMTARIRAPGYPGTYLLVWDVVQEHRTWLSLEGVYPGRTLAHVEGAAMTAPLPARGRMPAGVMRMPRSALWQTALRVWRAHPWLGIGPDNFRHTYGRYLGLAAWDTRVHANNTYLEILVGTGAAGMAASLWLIIASLRAVRRRYAAVTRESVPLFAAASAAVLAIAVHGLVDSFWTFTPTYVVFAIAAGLLFRSEESGPSVPSVAPALSAPSVSAPSAAASEPSVSAPSAAASEPSVSASCESPSTARR